MTRIKREDCERDCVGERDDTHSHTHRVRQNRQRADAAFFLSPFFRVCAGREKNSAQY